MSAVRTIGTGRDTTRKGRLGLFHKTKIAFLIASFVSLALSVGLWATGNELQAIFVGLWVPSIHSLGTLVLTGERDIDE